LIGALCSLRQADAVLFTRFCCNEFAFNFGVTIVAIWHLRGMVVVGVKMDKK